MDRFNSAIVSAESIEGLAIWLICGMTTIFCIYARLRVRSDPQIPMIKIARSFWPTSYSLFKVILNIYIIGWVFFRDFEHGKWVFSLPEKMDLSAFLVGLLAILGLIDSAVETISRLIDSED